MILSIKKDNFDKLESSCSLFYQSFKDIFFNQKDTYLSKHSRPAYIFNDVQLSLVNEVLQLTGLKEEDSFKNKVVHSWIHWFYR